MLQGKPAGEPEAVTMSAIKSILEEHKPEFEDLRQSSTRELTPQTPSRVARDPSAGSATIAPQESQVSGEVEPANIGTSPDAAHALHAEAPSRSGQINFNSIVSILSRPTDMFRHITIGRVLTVALIAAAVIRPGLVFGLMALWFFGIAGAFLVFGSERVWASVASFVAAYVRRRPQQSVRIYEWLDSVAYRWDAVLDMLPEGSVDGLYMPDFAHVEEQRLREDDAIVARLARMRSQT